MTAVQLLNALFNAGIVISVGAPSLYPWPSYSSWSTSWLFANRLADNLGPTVTSSQ